MSTKFDNVPVENDTKIILQLGSKLGKYDVLYQKWFWDGITAESIIFDNKDIPELTEDEVETEIRKSPLLKTGSSITIKKSDSGFTFVNFNFVTE